MNIKFYDNFSCLDELIDFYQNRYKLSRSEARKQALSDIPKESAFQSAILKYLNSLEDCLAWKDQAGMYQSKGVPDIICIRSGRFYGFEIKRPFVGRLSENQKAFHDKIRKAGGSVYVVSLVSEIIDIFNNDR